jgi:hypothetical protein
VSHFWSLLALLRSLTRSNLLIRPHDTCRTDLNPEPLACLTPLPHPPSNVDHHQCQEIEASRHPLLPLSSPTDDPKCALDFWSTPLQCLASCWCASPTTCAARYWVRNPWGHSSTDYPTFVEQVWGGIDIEVLGHMGVCVLFSFFLGTVLSFFCCFFAMLVTDTMANITRIYDAKGNPNYHHFGL